MKVFTVVINGKDDITVKDIQDYIWMNLDGEFTMEVAGIEGVGGNVKS